MPAAMQQRVAVVEEVPSPIDLRRMSDARNWEQSAKLKRPWRTDFFDAFSAAIRKHPGDVHRILELGSGPGFLAEHVFRQGINADYTALDFSNAMHALAKARLGPTASRVHFRTRSFRSRSWPRGLGHFDIVLTNQAVHELRHKSYALALHQQVRKILHPPGLYLVCDHFAGPSGMSNHALYMTVDEQKAALQEAGFATVETLLVKGGLALHAARI